MASITSREITNAKRAVKTAIKEIEASGVFGKSTMKSIRAAMNAVLIALTALDEKKLDKGN